MRDKAANNYPHGIKFVSDCFKTHKMCCKTFYNWYVPDQFKTHEICDEAVDKIPFVLDSIPDQYKTQVMCDEIAFDDPFKFKNAKHLKKEKRGINANSVVSYKMVVFLHVWRWGKRNKKWNRFLLSNTLNASVVWNMKTLERFVIENHTWRFQIFSCLIFGTKCSKIYVIKYLK